MNNQNIQIMLISVSPENAVGGMATWTKGFLSYCEKKKIACQLIDTSKINNIQYGGIIKEIHRTIRIFKNLKISLDTKKYDVVHLNTSIGVYGIIRDYLIAKYIKQYNVPLVTHFHCDIAFWDKNKITNKFISNLLKLSDMKYVLCNSSKTYLYDRYNCSSELIPNYIDLSIVENSKHINKFIKTVVYTGRVSINKGSPEIFEVAKRFPEISFLLVGNVLAEMNKFYKPDNVTLSGQKKHDEILKLLRESDVFLFPSHSEGFSIALTEAMAKGLPCIVTDVGANADMVSAGAGIVVQVGDIESLEVALNTMKDQQIRKTMSNNSIKKVKECYMLDIVMENIIDLYKKVLK